MNVSAINRHATEAMREVDISHHTGREDELRHLLDLAERTSKSYKIEAATSSLKILGAAFGILSAILGATLGPAIGAEMAGKVSSALTGVSQACSAGSDVAGVYPKAQLSRLQSQVSDARTYLDNLTQEMSQARQVSRETREAFQRAQDMTHDSLRAILEAARS